jgi:hypothetical protein
MKLKNFEHLGVDPTGEIQVDADAIEAEKADEKGNEAAKASQEAKGGKIDRRQKLAPKPEAAIAVDSPDKKYFDQAQKELSMEGEEYTSQDIHDRALRIKFSGMQSNTLVDKAAGAYVTEGYNKFNADMKAEAKVQREKDDKNRQSPQAAASPEVVAESQNMDEYAARKHETEQRRKWQEVDRVEALEREKKRNEAKPMVAFKTVVKNPLQGREEDRAHIERIEQGRKREEEARVKSLTPKKEEVKKSGVFRDLIFRKNAAPHASPEAAEKERIEQERKREEATRVKNLKTPEKAEPKKSGTFKDLLFGKK